MTKRDDTGVQPATKQNILYEMERLIGSWEQGVGTAAAMSNRELAVALFDICEGGNERRDDGR